MGLLIFSFATWHRVTSGPDYCWHYSAPKGPQTSPWPSLPLGPGPAVRMAHVPPLPYFGFCLVIFQEASWSWAAGIWNNTFISLPEKHKCRSLRSPLTLDPASILSIMLLVHLKLQATIYLKWQRKSEAKWENSDGQSKSVLLLKIRGGCGSIFLFRIKTLRSGLTEPEWCLMCSRANAS